MSYTTLSVRLTTEDKENFDKFCKATGLNASVTITMFIKTVLREKRIPFTISTEPLDKFKDGKDNSTASDDD